MEILQPVLAYSNESNFLVNTSCFGHFSCHSLNPPTAVHQRHQHGHQPALTLWVPASIVHPSSRHMCQIQNREDFPSADNDGPAEQSINALPAIKVADPEGGMAVMGGAVWSVGVALGNWQEGGSGRKLGKVRGKAEGGFFMVSCMQKRFGVAASLYPLSFPRLQHFLVQRGPEKEMGQ